MGLVVALVFLAQMVGPVARASRRTGSKSPLASSVRSFRTASAQALRPAVDAFVRQIRYPAAGAQ